jgi:hypothetical protein
VTGKKVLHWHLPGPRSRGVVMRYGGGALLAGGLLPGDTSTGQVLRLNLRTGPVGAPGHLALAMHDSAGGVLGGRPAVVGGGAASELSDVQRLGRDGRWHVVGRLPGGARSDLSVVATHAGLVVLGGYDGIHTPTSVLATQNGSHFKVLGRLPSGVRYAGTARTGRYVWLVGGEVNDQELRHVWRVDTRSGKVKRFGRTPHPLGHEAVVPVGGRLLVMGGRRTTEKITSAMWWFDPRTRSWTHAGHLPYPVADAPTVRQGHHAYLLGGETPSFTAKVTRVTWR